MRFTSCLRPAVVPWGAVGASLVWLLTTAPIQAQTVVDGSDKSLASTDLALLLSVLKSKLPAPKSAQIRGIVEAKPGVYCGEVSTRGRDGKYGEFARFAVETKIRQATVTPTTDPARVEMILSMINHLCRG